MGKGSIKKLIEKKNQQAAFASQQGNYRLTSTGTSTPGLFSKLTPNRGGASPESTPTRIARR